MEFTEVVTTRRSIRAYLDEAVSDELIEKLISAAMMAPSAGNQQPWQFIVVRDRKKLEAIPGFHPYCRMVPKAPAAIVVCGDPVGKKWSDFWVQDCSAAIQNLLLAARAEGLATVWTGVYPVEERVKGCRELFSIPDQVIPLAIIPIGWPAKEGEFKRIDRFNQGLVHQELFGNQPGITG
jgi:nitroreductase